MWSKSPKIEVFGRPCRVQMWSCAFITKGLGGDCGVLSGCSKEIWRSR